MTGGATWDLILINKKVADEGVRRGPALCVMSEEDAAQALASDVLRLRGHIMSSVLWPETELRNLGKLQASVSEGIVAN